MVADDLNIMNNWVKYTLVLNLVNDDDSFVGAVTSARATLGMTVKMHNR
jgi:hypothetical protein